MLLIQGLLRESLLFREDIMNNEIKHYAVLKFRLKNNPKLFVWKNQNYFYLKSRFNRIKDNMEMYYFTHETKVL